MSALSSQRSTSTILRYEQVIAVLFKYGFEDLLSHSAIGKFLPKSKMIIPVRDGRLVSEYNRYERIRLACEELGTTFIKFAQIASNRPDLLPEDLIEELSRLQDRVPEVPEKDIREVLSEDLSRPLEELVEYFDYRPIASASIAQVHRARLIGGREVVLKIQRPGIKATIEADIKILRNLATSVERHFPKYASYHPMELVKMFEQAIRKELKFTLEASNVRRFQRMFKGHSKVYVPVLYDELITDNILCMEYIDGYKITDLDNLNELGISGPELAKKGIELYFEQVFEHGFFHADPHPGNIFVTKNRKICFLDYGMMGTVIEKDKELFGDLLLALYLEEVEDLKNAVLSFSSNLSEDKIVELEYDLIDFLANYRSISIENLDNNEVMRGLNALFFDYKIKIPANLLLLLKALIIIEGVGLKIDPDYNIIENIGPFVQRLQTRSYSLRNIKTTGIKSIQDSVDTLINMPGDIKDIVKKVKEGKLHIEFEHKGLEPINRNWEIISNRISFTLVLAALILGSSILVLADTPPHYYNVSIIGLLGFIISGVLGIRLLFSIIKHGMF
jgi:ubiquinone biosynthesis protein